MYTYLCVSITRLAFWDSLTNFRPPRILELQCCLICKTSTMSAVTSLRETPWWNLFLFLIYSTIDLSSSTVNIRRCSFFVLMFFPTRRRSIVPLSFIKGNIPVFNAEWAFFPLALHQFTASSIWVSFLLIFFLLTIASAFELGLPDTGKICFLTLSLNPGFPILIFIYFYLKNDIYKCKMGIKSLKVG